MASPSRVATVLLVVIGVVLHFAFLRGADSHDASAYAAAPVQCDVDCGAHGRAVLAGKECVCRCTAGYGGARCELPPLTVAPAPQPQPQPVAGGAAETAKPREEMDEAEKALEDHPYLKTDPGGYAAVNKANEVWAERMKAAYREGEDDITGEEGLHLYFTTDCTQHSLWQACTLEDSWAEIKQPGAISRVVSGCYASDGKKHRNADLLRRQTIDHPKAFVFFAPRAGRTPSRAATKCPPAEKGGWHDGAFLAAETAGSVAACTARCEAEAQCRSYNFRESDGACHLFSSRDSNGLHADPGHWSGVCTGTVKEQEMPAYLKSYAPINRPFAAMYWLKVARPRERIVGLLDPDMVFITPIRWHYARSPPVERKRPVAQFYDYLAYQKWHHEKEYREICPENCPPLSSLKLRDFAMGPPHLMHRDDWVDVAPLWLRYTVVAKRLWDAWTSEMTGMLIALVRFNLPAELEMHGMWDGKTHSTAMLKRLDYRALAEKHRPWLPCAEEGKTCTVPRDTQLLFGRPDLEHVVVPAAAGAARCEAGAEGPLAGVSRPVEGHPVGCYLLNHERDAKALELGSAAAEWMYCSEEGRECRLPEGAFAVRCGEDVLASFTEEERVEGPAVRTCSCAGAGRRQCFYRFLDEAKRPPLDVRRYIPQKDLPHLFHYCYTMETNRKDFPESVWHFASGQLDWEKKHQHPLLTYLHWSKYRSLTDWGGAHTKTLLDCGQPSLFQFPPLPHMLSEYSHIQEDMAWHAHMAVVLPAINRAVMRYRLRYCGDTPINKARVVRTAHDTFWLTKFETVLNTTDPKGFSIVRANEAA